MITMKKILILLFVLLAIASTTNAQTISREVISNGGGTLKGGSSQITFTIGETLIPSTVTAAMLTAGFQQPGEQIKAGSVAALLCAGSSFNLPYTATDIVEGNTFTAQLSDFNGSFANPVNIGSLSGNASGAEINVTIPANTIAGNGYRIRITSSSPAFIGTDNGANIRVNAAPIASINYSGSPYFCPTGSASVTRSGQTGGSYTASPSGLSINSATGVINLAASTTGTYVVTYNFTNTICTNTATAIVTINALPVGPVVAAQNFCTSATVASLPNGNRTYKWYSAPTGGTVLANTAALSMGTYFVSSTTGGCESARTAVPITINKAAIAGAITSAASVCAGGTITFTSAAYTGSSIQWEVSTTSATAGFSAVAGANQLAFTMNAVANTSSSLFYVRNVVSNGNCNTARSAVKTITVIPLSVPGTVTGGGTICLRSGGTLRVTGNTGTIQWQSSADGINYVNVRAGIGSAGTNYVSGSATGTAATYVVNTITANTYFRAKLTSGACSESYSNAVQYTIGATAVAGSIPAINTTVCSGTGTTMTLTGSVGAIQWQKSTNWATARPRWTIVTSSTSASLATENLTLNTAYRAVVTIGSCSAATSRITTVMVNSAPLAKPITANVTSPTGATAALAICNSVAKTLTIGAGYLGSVQWQASTTSTTLGYTDIVDAKSSSYTITRPAVGVNYFRAKFTNSCGVIVYSSVFTVYFTNCPVKAKVVQPRDALLVVPFNVVAYPNPSSDEFNLTVTTTSSDTVLIEVFDMLGRMVKHIEAEEGEPILFGKELPVGDYITNVSQGNSQKIVRLIKK